MRLESGLTGIPLLRSGPTDQITVSRPRDIGDSRQTVLISGAEG
jgi:hypothetical protein